MLKYLSSPLNAGATLGSFYTSDVKVRKSFDTLIDVFAGFLPDSGIEKEIGALQSEEKKLVAEIKRTAKTGNEAATKILARQLVRLRQQIASLQASRAQMRGIATHTQAMHAHSSVAVGLKNATKAMTSMNKLSTAPKGKIAGKNKEDVGSSGIGELDKRLAALRNP
ncbi:hypothetical protein GH714_030387 [Hevea brasiliensis]|uniref:Uncharacterized protein n=1 Tax=Hevea brasiliensis TaxID=3981 RepID=A0A6A6KEQ8_HEVBR|nr:hypothetical protein GH714_030387 [Hevea brasiliensis]